MKKLTSILAPAAGVVLLLSACAPTPAATPTETVEFPEAGSNVTVVVPYSAGGTTDVTARAFTAALAEELGVNVEVLNTPGAGGQLGLTELAGADPDGYTIGFTNIPSTIPTYVIADRGATYTRESFEPIAALTRTTNYMAVSASSPYETLDDLLEAAADAPGAITVGTASEDETLGVEAAAESAGVEFNVVPYDGGPEKTTALLGGQVDAIIGGGTTIVPGVTNGDFRALGIFGGEQDPFLPEIPTFSSLGIDLDINGFLIVSAPAGTPPEIVDIFEAAAEQAVADTTFQTTVEASFQEPMYVGSEEIAGIWADQEALFTERFGD
ncbi:tripartite tricarboxylate transporter substrate binding protein [Agrococcus sp. ARC_14]|uniref:tripartite tricarboxylate transporter substrate binding protein n=1 Tax=Agrococcus sp. ARC_14 TaxID=2919927 RepID=UPI001F069BDE|nr:tripartite tricarboxylate transporter substrate binding protein [Agrococcus sp. ARC_14]MCH1881916.1 tripartite tricarboxylate transporter substrate binding protein [Agrococcus sp. ARC_14]